MNRQIQSFSSTAIALLFASQFALADHRPNHGGGGAGDDSGGGKKTQCKLEIAASFREKKGIPCALEALARIEALSPIEVTIIGDASSTPNPMWPSVERDFASTPTAARRSRRTGIRGSCASTFHGGIRPPAIRAIH